MSLSYWDYLSLLILRPLFAITVVFLFISVGWWLAWKLVLVHVPLVQEIFGLRKKPVQPKPPTRRFSKIYNTIEAHNSASKWGSDRITDSVVSCVFGGQSTANTKVCFFDATNKLSLEIQVLERQEITLCIYRFYLISSFCDARSL
ncbi:hypothetical protein ACFX2I_019473 [Malus domestica]|nr:uncharacterized protein LOC126605937 isoform X2 [Malus sylvestris]